MASERPGWQDIRNPQVKLPQKGDELAMNIVVCVKYVPDAQSDRTFNESDNTTDRLGVDGLLSELDEYAIEAGLKLAESAAADDEPVAWLAKPTAALPIGM